MLLCQVVAGDGSLDTLDRLIAAVFVAFAADGLSALTMLSSHPLQHVEPVLSVNKLSRVSLEIKCAAFELVRRECDHRGSRLGLRVLGVELVRAHELIVGSHPEPSPVIMLPRYGPEGSLQLLETLSLVNELFGKLFRWQNNHWLPNWDRPAVSADSFSTPRGGRASVRFLIFRIVCLAVIFLLRIDACFLVLSFLLKPHRLFFPLLQFKEKVRNVAFAFVLHV